MFVSKALSTFRQDPYRYNCAQTVCAAFERADLLEKMQACGGGRAPNGWCGALWAALNMLPQELHSSLMEQFKNETGALQCYTLKKEMDPPVPCELCVTCATRLVQQHHDQLLSE